MPRVTASFTIPDDLLRMVDEVADAKRLSRSQLLETWIREQIEGEKTTVAMMGNPVVMQAMIGAFAKPEVMRAMAAAVGDELDDEQLKLFHRGLASAQEQAAASVKPKGKSTAMPPGRWTLEKKRRRKK